MTAIDAWVEWLGTERLDILNGYRVRAGEEPLSAEIMARVIIQMKPEQREAIKALCA